MARKFRLRKSVNILIFFIGPVCISSCSFYSKSDQDFEVLNLEGLKKLIPGQVIEIKWKNPVEDGVEMTVSGEFDPVNNQILEQLDETHFLAKKSGKTELKYSFNGPFVQPIMEEGFSRTEVQVGCEVYEFYNTQTGQYLYSSAEEDLHLLQLKGFEKQNTAWYSPYKTGTAVNRLYNKQTNEYFYSSDEKEINLYTDDGWVNEGICFWSDKDEDTVIYSLQDTSNGAVQRFTDDPEIAESLSKSSWIVSETPWFSMLPYNNGLSDY